MTSARRVAATALDRIEQGAYANLVLPGLLVDAGLSPADRRFVTELVYGTTRLRRACDVAVDRFVTSSPDAATRTLLRLGAYQLLFAGVPAHAAVSETVGLAPRRTRGFVNAVLRRVASAGDQVAWPSRWAELSYPDWLADRLVAELGDGDALATLGRMNEPPPVHARDDGYIQDLSSQWVAAAVEPAMGERVFDACAAPGGKATALAAAGAEVVAGDVRPGRVGLLAGNVARVGGQPDGAADGGDDRSDDRGDRAAGRGGVRVVAADATAPPFAPGSFDAVLLDAPCSGLGALRRRADARWRVTAADISTLARLQAEMRAACATLVRPGGRLIYSVCTLTAEESIDHPPLDGFDVDDSEPPIGTWRAYGPGWRVLPHDADTDGMVLVRYRRRP